MHVAYEVTFICYSPFSLDIFPRNVQNKPIKFKQFQEKLYHETGVFTLKGTGRLDQCSKWIYMLKAYFPERKS